LKTVCTHCGKWFKVSDKALGKRARCRQCGKPFLVKAEAVEDIHMEAVDAPPSMGSMSQLSAVMDDEFEDDDPLAALAGAASDVNVEHNTEAHQHARERESFSTRREAGDILPTPTSAVTACVLSITGSVFGLWATVTAVAIFAKKYFAIDFWLWSAIGGAVLCGLLCIIGIALATGALNRARRSRGAIGGKGVAHAGMLVGWAGIILCIAGGVFLMLWLNARGGVKKVITSPPAVISAPADSWSR